MHLTAEDMSERAENAKKKLSAHCVLRATAVKKVVESQILTASRQGAKKNSSILCVSASPAVKRKLMNAFNRRGNE